MASRSAKHRGRRRRVPPGCGYLALGRVSSKVRCQLPPVPGAPRVGDSGREEEHLEHVGFPKARLTLQTGPQVAHHRPVAQLPVSEGDDLLQGQVGFRHTVNLYREDDPGAGDLTPTGLDARLRAPKEVGITFPQASPDALLGPDRGPRLHSTRSCSCGSRSLGIGDRGRIGSFQGALGPVRPTAPDRSGGPAAVRHPVLPLRGSGPESTGGSASSPSSPFSCGWARR